jgi:hypothetical protein
MAVADWRRSRLWCLEMAQYTHAIHAQERANDPIADHENAEIPSMHTALAFFSLCDNSCSLSSSTVMKSATAATTTAPLFTSKRCAPRAE